MRKLFNAKKHDELVATIKDYGDLAVEFEFYLGNYNLSDRLDKGDYKIGGDSPAWNLSANVTGRIPRQYRNAPARMVAHIGDIQLTAMAGKSSLPVSSSDDFSTDLLVATPGHLLDKTSLRSFTTYSGRTPRNVLRDALQRVRDYSRSRIEIPDIKTPLITRVGGDGFSARDNAKSVVDIIKSSLDLRIFDTIWDTKELGTRVYRAAGTGEGLPVVWEYYVDSAEVFEFPEPQFATPDEQYTEVAIVQEQDGDIETLAEVKVNYFGLPYPPAADQTLYVDWQGHEGGNPRQLAIDTARTLRQGTYGASLSAAYNPLLEPQDIVVIYQNYEDDTGFYERTWRALIEGLTHPFGEGISTQIDASAWLISEDRLPDPYISLPGVTPGNVTVGIRGIGDLKPRPYLKPHIGLKPRGPARFKSAGLRPMSRLKPKPGMKPRPKP